MHPRGWASSITSKVNLEPSSCAGQDFARCIRWRKPYAAHRDFLGRYSRVADRSLPKVWKDTHKTTTNGRHASTIDGRSGLEGWPEGCGNIIPCRVSCETKGLETPKAGDRQDTDAKRRIRVSTRTLAPDGSKGRCLHESQTEHCVHSGLLLCAQLKNSQLGNRKKGDEDVL